MNLEDLLDLQRRQEDANVTNRRKRIPINERTCIQKLRRKLVDAIHNLRSGISHNGLIKFMEKGLLPTKHFKITWYRK